MAEDRRLNVLVASVDGSFCDTVETCGSETIAAFKTSIKQKYGPVAGIKLTLDEVELRDNRLVREYNISEESFISMSVTSTGAYEVEEPSSAGVIEAKEIRIYVGFLSTKKRGFDIDVDQSTTIEGLKALIMSKDPDCDPDQQRIFLNGSNLQDDNTLAHYNIDDGANLFVMLKEPDLIPPNSGYTLLYVSCEDKIHTVCLESNNATIRQVKRLVWEKTEILPAYQRLNFCGENLEQPDKRLSDYGRDGGIKAESLLYLYRRKTRDAEPGYSTLPPGMNPDLQTVQQNTQQNQNTQPTPVQPEDDDMITIHLMNLFLASEGVPFKLKPDAPLSQIFRAYAQQVRMAPSELEFMHDVYGDLTADCELSAEALGMKNDDTIMVSSKMSSPMFPMSEPMPMPPQQPIPSNEIDLTPFSPGAAISVTLKGVGSDVSAKITKETTLELLFEYFADKEGVESELLLYACNGKRYSYKTDKTAAQCGIEDGDIIHVSWRAREEKKATAEIADFIHTHHQRHKAKKIAADQREARKTIDHFVWKSIVIRRAKRRKARRIIADFVWKSIAIRRWRKLRDSAKLAQRIFRGHSARKIHGEMVQIRLIEFRQFTSVWKQAAEAAAERAAAPPTLTGWALVRDEINMKKAEDEDENMAETDEKLSKALAGALKVEDEFVEDEVESDLEDDAMESNIIEAQEKLAMIDWSQFQVTSHVCKFLKTGDTKYREIFAKKMTQLAKGERSHKLQKPLQGCESVIFETYLENKSGWRILWTQEGDRLVIWFVCQHKSVSRHAKLIDDAKNRAARQQLPDSFIAEMENDISSHEEKMDVKLDPYGNVPLKLYDLSFDNVNDIVDESWTPQMHLTQEERDVVEAKGTVLLLGRSGTGKTICIINKMEHDRQTKSKNKPDFSQLFVARSRKLCSYVQDAVGNNEVSSFTTFDSLVNRIEASLSESTNQNFRQSRHVDFSRFKNEFYIPVYPREDISALIVWKAIRTFLKGSIDAFKETGAVLSRGNFIGLGKNRCKVPLNLRDPLYDIFLQYQQWINDEHLWDDMDRILALVKSIEDARRSHSPVYEEEIKKTRLYVDEVQDYTQLEILLFFYIGGGPGALFLAGDPAQSVAEGTDFRFEDVRGVGYFVAGDQVGNKRHLVPEKPKVVNVNFRSHAGVLNCAGGFLDLLFTHFPGSAKQLKKDHGLFKGARPGVFQGVQVQQLSTFLKEKMPGAVVLTHDDSAASWSEKLDHRLVYGIREAKGMEFKTVIILDFFAELPSSLQKPWRDLLLNRYREEDGFQQEFPLVETHLKLIYTGVTRCIDQLFFAETISSNSGDAAVRWLTTTSTSTTMERANNSTALATISDVNDLEAMSMTNDEFCVVGIDNAELAESSIDLPQDAIQNYLDRAIYCFLKAQSPELVAKAQVHSQSIRMRDRLAHTNYLMAKGDLEQDIEQLEKEAAQIISSLFRENLFVESENLLNSIIPLLSPYTQQKLEECITSPLHILNA